MNHELKELLQSLMLTVFAIVAIINVKSCVAERDAIKLKKMIMIEKELKRKQR